MTMPPEMRRSLRAGLLKFHDELAKKEEQDQSIFRIKPITNGHLVEYDDVEEYEIKVPSIAAYDPTAPRPKLGQLPKMAIERRWRYKRATVFCADAAAIKAQVDYALDLERRIKELIAQGILTEGQTMPGFETDLAVGT